MHVEQREDSMTDKKIKVAIDPPVDSSRMTAGTKSDIILDILRMAHTLYTEEMITRAQYDALCRILLEPDK
jgi:hypothetical protein